MNDWSAVTSVLDEHRTRYEGLLKDVRGACEEVRSRLPHAIADVYSRGALQSGMEFKRAHKIAAKLRGRDLAVAEDTILELNDVVGVTVVVRYPDETDGVVAALRARLAQTGVDTSAAEPKEITERGYYATHLVCARYDISRYRCEIQIKSPLHDAWSRKTHDLTYKPAGALDPRLKALMGSIAATLETLERQSMLIRDIIVARWDLEQDVLRQVRSAMSAFIGSAHRTFEKEAQLPPNDELDKIWTQVDADEDKLRSLPTQSAEMQAIMQRVDACCADFAGLRRGWLLAGRLATLRADGALSGYLRRHVKRFLRLAEAPENRNILDAELVAVPMMLYAVGELDEAIGISERLLDPAVFPAIGERARLDIDFNKACFLTEREYFTPTADAEPRALICQQVIASLERQRERNDLDLASAIQDADGLAKIAFAQTAKEVRDGIDLCDRAPELEQGDRTMANVYRELNIRLGWRRFFDLEMEERHASRRTTEPK